MDGGRATAIAFTYAWWLTGDEDAAAAAVRAASSGLEGLEADDGFMEALLREVRRHAAPAPTMCPSSELALLHDTSGLSLDAACRMVEIDEATGRAALAHGRLEALVENVRDPFEHPERLGGLAVGNPADVAHARQCESCGRAERLLIAGRRELSGIGLLSVPHDLADAVPRAPSTTTPRVVAPTRPADPVTPPPLTDAADEGTPPDAVAVAATVPDAAPDTDRAADLDAVADADRETGPAATDARATADAPAGPDTLDAPAGPTAIDERAPEGDAVPPDDAGTPTRTVVTGIPGGLGDDADEGTRRTVLVGLLVATGVVLLLVVYSTWRGRTVEPDPGDEPTVEETASDPDIGATSSTAAPPASGSPSAVPTSSAPASAPTGEVTSTPSPSATGVPPSAGPFTVTATRLSVAGAEVAAGGSVPPDGVLTFELDYSGAAGGVAVLATWTVDDAPYDELLVVLTRPEGTHAFGGPPPSGGWPPGEHHVVLDVEGRVVGQVTFVVTAPAGDTAGTPGPGG